MKVSAWLFLFLLTLLGAGLRVSMLDSGISIDGLVSHYVASSENLDILISRIREFEYSPPLYFCLLHLWMQQFGESPSAMSSLSALFGVLLIPACFYFGEYAYQDKRVGFVMAFFACVSSCAIFFSQDVRAYSLLSLLTVLLAYCFARAARAWQASLQSRLFCLASFLFTVLILYTHYVGILIIAGFGFSAITISFSRGRDKSRSALEFLVSILCGCLAFIPWLDFFIEHRNVGTFWAEPTSWQKFPLVITSNFAAALPLPWIIGFCISVVVLPIFFILAIKNLSSTASSAQRVSNQSGTGSTPVGFRRKLEMIAPRYTDRVNLLLMLNLMAPICLFGYITPFIPGYNRYMMPYCFLAWALLAFLLVNSWGRAESAIRKLMQRNENTPDEKNLSGTLRVRLQDRKLLGRVDIIAILTCLALVLIWLNFDETTGLATSGRSGLRQLARDLSAGAYGPLESCAILIAPEHDLYGLSYYLEKEFSRNLPSRIYTFPEREKSRRARKNEIDSASVSYQVVKQPFAPSRHIGYPEAFQQEDSIEKALDWVRSIKAQGQKELLLVLDLDAGESRLMPAKSRLKELVEALDDIFERSGSEHNYHTRGHSFDLIVYRLDEPDVENKEPGKK